MQLQYLNINVISFVSDKGQQCPLAMGIESGQLNVAIYNQDNSSLL